MNKTIRQAVRALSERFRERFGKKRAFERLAKDPHIARFTAETKKKREAFRAKRRKPTIDLALSETVSFLRNAIAGGALPSAEQLLSELATFDSVLAPGFAAMLSRLRQNDPKGALTAFTEFAGDREGGDIGRLLIQWDSLEADELTETLFSYQRHLSEVRYTLYRKADELASDLLYIPVVANVMLVFINFIFVGYFLEEQELFELIF